MQGQNQRVLSILHYTKPLFGRKFQRGEQAPFEQQEGMSPERALQRACLNIAALGAFPRGDIDANTVAALMPGNGDRRPGGLHYGHREEDLSGDRTPADTESPVALAERPVRAA